MTEIPRQALDLNYNSSGFLPDVGLYQHGGKFHQGMSRSHYWLFGVLLIGAIVVALLPWHTRAAVGELKYWIAGMFLSGGLCDLLGSLVRRAVTQQVSIDPKSKTVLITADAFNLQLSWEQVVGLQICQQKIPGNSEINGYQLNLVWREPDGSVGRRCLYKHAIQGFVTRLARRYESLFGFTIIDHTQPESAPNATLQRRLS